MVEYNSHYELARESSQWEDMVGVLEARTSESFASGSKKNYYYSRRLVNAARIVKMIF